MAANDCQETGVIYSGGAAYVGWGTIEVTDITCPASDEALIDVVTPWSYDDDDVVIELDETITWDNGTEHYSITCDVIFCGTETNHAEFTECWWVDDGNRYVKTDGDDSDNAYDWDHAWANPDYAFQNCPAGKNLYVEEGLYGGQTLANINPANPPLSVYIQPSTHTNDPCNVWISDNIVFTDGYTSSHNTVIDTTIYTFIDLNNPISFTGKLHAFDIYLQNAHGGNYKLKVFRDDGTNYVFIGESEFVTLPVAVGNTLYTYNKCSINVEAGDYFAIYSTGVVGYTASYLDSAKSAQKSGDIKETTAKSTWSDSPYNQSLCVLVRGFK